MAREDGEIRTTGEAWEYIASLDRMVASGQITQNERDTERDRVMMMMHQGTIREAGYKGQRIVVLVISVILTVIGLALSGAAGPSIISVACLAIGIIGMVKAARG